MAARRETFNLPQTDPVDPETPAPPRPRNETNEDTWQPRDIGLGLVFLITGAMICFLTWRLYTAGLPTRVLLLLSPLAFLIGPILVLLGFNAILRAIIAGLRGHL